MIDEPLPVLIERGDVVGGETDVIHPGRQAEAGADRGIKFAELVDVEVPHREALAVAGVVEEVAHATGLLGIGSRFGVDEPESHDLGVEAMGRVEVVGGDGDVVERHRGIVDRGPDPTSTIAAVVAGEAELHEHDVGADPFVTFRQWFDDTGRARARSSPTR